MIRPHSPSWPWLGAAFAYYLAATFGHEWMSNLYNSVFKIFGRETMELSLAVIFLALLLAVGAALLVRAGSKGRLDRSTVIAGALTVVLMVLADKLLVCTNVEMVHFPQYAFLALLLRLCLKHEFFILCLCTAGGVFDELMQYVMFPNYTKYLDFNDFILNLLGAAAGLVAARILMGRAGEPGPLEHRAGRLAAVAGLLFVAAVGAAWLLGLAVSHVPVETPGSVLAEVGGGRVFVLSYVRPEGTFSLTGFGRSYYILRPLEGTAVLSALLAVYFVLFRRAKDSTASA